MNKIDAFNKGSVKEIISLHMKVYQKKKKKNWLSAKQEVSSH